MVNKSLSTVYSDFFEATEHPNAHWPRRDSTVYLSIPQHHSAPRQHRIHDRIGPSTLGPHVFQFFPVPQSENNLKTGTWLPRSRKGFSVGPRAQSSVPGIVVLPALLIACTGCMHHPVTIAFTSMNTHTPPLPLAVRHPAEPTGTVLNYSCYYCHCWSAVAGVNGRPTEAHGIVSSGFEVVSRWEALRCFGLLLVQLVENGVWLCGFADISGHRAARARAIPRCSVSHAICTCMLRFGVVRYIYKFPPQQLRG